MDKKPYILLLVRMEGDAIVEISPVQAIYVANLKKLTFIIEGNDGVRHEIPGTEVEPGVSGPVGI